MEGNEDFMKICFIAPADNYHTQKWCKWFSANGYQVEVISFTKGDIQNCVVHYIDCGVDVNQSDSKKIKYLFQVWKVHNLIKKIKPDIINAHYASSYGSVAALACLSSYYLSVWGSDIYDFPKKSIFHKLLLKFSLWRATYLFSTSKAMAKEAAKYTSKKFEITPFGVDCTLFNPNKRTRKDCDGKFVVGTVKSLSPKYGIATLLKAVSLVKKSSMIHNLELRIAGKGPYEAEYKRLASDLGIDDITVWLGFISQEEAAVEWANMDCAIIPSESESESFGVSAVEAQACGTATIISDIPGLMEATKPGLTSVVVRRGDVEELAKKISELYIDYKMRIDIGNKGRKFVSKNYELNKCFNKITKIYEINWRL